MDIKKLTAQYGRARFAWGLYKDNITDKAVFKTAERLGMKAVDVPCEECRSERGYS